MKCNINRALTNGRARFKYFPGATSEELLHYIDATLEESNFEVALYELKIGEDFNEIFYRSTIWSLPTDLDVS